MIISCLFGGLGNQMFQYALGRHLAEKNKTKLVLDITRFKDDPKRNYALDNFEINARIAEYEELRGFNEVNKYQRVWFKVRRFFENSYIPHVEEKSLCFHPEVLRVTKAYLEGYWQSEKYFFEIFSILQKEFKLKKALNSEENRFANMIFHAKNSVSLHVRRGDYITDLNANEYHGICEISYYNDAINYLQYTVGGGGVRIYICLCFPMI